MEKIISKKNKMAYVKLTVLYMLSRNIFNMGYMEYGYFKNIIRYVIDDFNPKLIRYIFSGLLSRGIIKKVKVKKHHSCLYIFNPYNKIFKPNIKIQFN